MVARLSASSIDEPLLVVIGRGPSSRSAAVDRHPSPTIGICRGPSSRGPSGVAADTPVDPLYVVANHRPWSAHPPSRSRIYRRTTCQSPLISHFAVSSPPHFCFHFCVALPSRHYWVMLSCICGVVFSLLLCCFGWFCMLCGDFYFSCVVLSPPLPSFIFVSFFFSSLLASGTPRSLVLLACHSPFAGTVPFPRRVVARDCCPPTAIAESCPPCCRWPKLLWAVLLSPFVFPPCRTPFLFLTALRRYLLLSLNHDELSLSHPAILKSRRNEHGPI